MNITVQALACTVIFLLYFLYIMRISFIVPAYNEEKYISKCLMSIEEELERTHCDAEVIVVNNASTDATAEIAREFANVRVVDEVHKGLVYARHAGMKESTGDIVANVDSDTILPEGWLSTVLKEFSNDSQLVALSGPFIYYDLSFRHRLLVKIFYIFGYFAQWVFKIFGMGAMLQGGNFVIRRVPFEKIGGFDTSIEFYGEDTDVACRLSRVGKVKWTFCLPMYTSGRRLSQEGVVKTGTRYAINFFHVIFFRKPLTAKHVDVRF